LPNLPANAKYGRIVPQATRGAVKPLCHLAEEAPPEMASRIVQTVADTVIVLRTGTSARIEVVMVVGIAIRIRRGRVEHSQINIIGMNAHRGMGGSNMVVLNAVVTAVASVEARRSVVPETLLPKDHVWHFNLVRRRP